MFRAQVAIPSKSPTSRKRSIGSAIVCGGAKLADERACLIGMATAVCVVRFHAVLRYRLMLHNNSFNPNTLRVSG
jgi:hypothetical protein